jgi:hypothetical protein
MHHITGDLELDGIDWGDLEIAFDGTPSWYLARRDCQGFAELKAKRGDMGAASVS